MSAVHSVPNGRKRQGRPPDPELAEIRERLLPQRSPRTQARFKRAAAILIALGISEERFGNVLIEATRPSGTLNVRLLERYAEAMLHRMTSGAA